MKYKFLLAIPVILLLGMGMGSVFGETPVTTPDLASYSTGLMVFLVAGLAYSTIGYRAKLLKRLQGEDVEFDPYRIIKAVLLGLVLGLGATVLSMYDGNVIVATNPHQFLTQVGVSMSTILVVHKLLLSTPK